MLFAYRYKTLLKLYIRNRVGIEDGLLLHIEMNQSCWCKF